MENESGVSGLDKCMDGDRLRRGKRYGEKLKNSATDVFSLESV